MNYPNLTGEKAEDPEAQCEYVIFFKTSYRYIRYCLYLAELKVMYIDGYHSIKFLGTDKSILNLLPNVNRNMWYSISRHFGKY